jgi:arabinofuranosyltransferase
MVRPSGKLLRGLALAAVATVYVFLALRLVAPYTPIDDAFISFRYARHLASGHGLAFNFNEPAVEGYSSLAWVLILAAGASLGIALPALSQILGFLQGAGTLLVLARRSLLAAAGLAVCLPWLYHTLNGLETCFATFLIAALTCVPPDAPRRRVASLLAAALLPITRPEGLMFVLAWVATVHLADRRLHRHEIRLALAALAAFAAQLAFRLAVHGDWIANSARAKVLPLGFTLGPGLLDLGRFLVLGSGGGSLLVLAAAGAWLSARSDGSDRSVESDRSGEEDRTLARVLFLALAASALAASGGDSFPLWRFYVPLAPVLFLAAAEGLEALLAVRPLPGRTVALVRGLAAAAVLAALIGPWRGFLPEIRREGSWVRHWERLGLRLAALLPPDTTIALCPVGALPYRSGFRTLDMLGLNDPHTARVKPDFSYYYPGHQRHDGLWILSQRPDLILLANGPVAADPAAPFPWKQVRPYEQDLVRDPRFAAEYGLTRIPLGDGTWLLAFARRPAI